MILRRLVNLLLSAGQEIALSQALEKLTIPHMQPIAVTAASVS